MARHTLGDIKLGLKDLFESKEKKKLFGATKTGGLYLDKLHQKYESIAALPAALVDSGLPLAEQLAETDARHDGYGRALYYLCEAYLQLPGLDAGLRGSVEKIRAKVIPSLGRLKEAYSKEAERAIDRAAALPDLKPDLKKLPVVGARTAVDWVEAFNQAGTELHELLAQRGTDAAGALTGSRKDALPLLTETLGLLGRARDALGDEVDGDPQLPRNLDGQIFGYFDELLRLREAHQSGKPAAAPAAPPAPRAGA